MEATLKVALGEQGHLQEFFAMLKQQGQEAQAEDIAQLLAQMEGMQTGFAEALDEIRYLREQIDCLQNQTVKAKLRKTQEEVQTVLKQAQNRTRSIKRTVNGNIKNAVAAGKQKGTQAIDRVFDVIPIYQGLGVAESFLTHSANVLSERIERIDMLADEVHAAKGHMQNAGKAITGKPMAEMEERDRAKGLLSKIEKSMEYCRKLVSGLAIRTIMAKAHVEHFRELSGKKAEDVPAVSEIAKKMREKAAVSVPAPWKLDEAR